MLLSTTPFSHTEFFFKETILTSAVLASTFQDYVHRREEGLSGHKRINSSDKASSPLVGDAGRGSAHDSLELDDSAILAHNQVIHPSLAGALVTGIVDFFTSLGETDLERTAIRMQVLFTRAFFALFNRKKLVLGSMVLHVLMACVLGWILGPSSEHVYNLSAFFAISTLILLFANIQIFYFTFTNHQVWLFKRACIDLFF